MNKGQMYLVLSHWLGGTFVFVSTSSKVNFEIVEHSNVSSAISQKGFLVK